MLRLMLASSKLSPRLCTEWPKLDAGNGELAGALLRREPRESLLELGLVLNRRTVPCWTTPRMRSCSRALLLTDLPTLFGLPPVPLLPVAGLPRALSLSLAGTRLATALASASRPCLATSFALLIRAASAGLSGAAGDTGQDSPLPSANRSSLSEERPKRMVFGVKQSETEYMRVSNGCLANLAQGRLRHAVEVKIYAAELPQVDTYLEKTRHS